MEAEMVRKEYEKLTLDTDIGQFKKNLCRYIHDSQKELSRYRSWNHCYEQFQAAFNECEVDRDLLCLWLAWYLASWGMLHNSKLLENNYKIHTAIVNTILDMDKKDLKCLNNLKCQDWLDNKENCRGKLAQLYCKIRDCYESLGVSGTDTLITKVLLGTLGCVPAFDNLFKKGISGKSNWRRRTLASDYLTTLSEFYVQHEKAIDKECMPIDMSGESPNSKMKKFPEMKILDMGFWKTSNK